MYWRQGDFFLSKLDMGPRMTNVALTVDDVAHVVGLPVSHIRSWLKRSAVGFGTRLFNRRVRFNLDEVRGLAVMRELVRHGQAPNRAAREAAAIVRQAGGKDAVAVCSASPDHAPVVVPPEYVRPYLCEVRIVVPLAPLWAEVDTRVAELRR